MWKVRQRYLRDDLLARNKGISNSNISPQISVEPVLIDCLQCSAAQRTFSSFSWLIVDYGHDFWIDGLCCASNLSWTYRRKIDSKLLVVMVVFSNQTTGSGQKLMMRMSQNCFNISSPGHHFSSTPTPTFDRFATSVHVCPARYERRTNHWSN